jgi:hypothetical protein
MTQYAIECTRAYIAGAVYSLADIIIFSVYEPISNSNKYLHICITQDDTEMLGMFEWDKIPKHIMDIYDYVSLKSHLKKSCDFHMLYGTHICRTKDYNMHIASFQNNPTDDSTLHIIQSTDITNSISDIIKDIGDNMRDVKKLDA